MEENKKGLAAAFATFSPFKSWCARKFAQPFVHTFAPKEDAGIRLLRFLHYGYWLSVAPRDLERAGVPAAHRPKHGGLLFVSAFNDDPSKYIKGFSDSLHGEMDKLWQQSEKWEGAEDLDKLNLFITLHCRIPNLFFNAYGYEDVKRLRKALLVRRTLEKLAAEHAGKYCRNDNAEIERVIADLGNELYGGGS